MHCILHIGTEKTGSTAIQHFLHNNWDIFKNQGVHICRSVGSPNNRSLPAAFLSEKKLDDFLRRLNHKNLEERRRWRQRVLKDFLAEVSRAEKKSGTFVVSSEHLQSKLMSLDEVRELQLFLQPLFDSISVVCYLRRQDQLAMSRYSEVLRAGHVFQSPIPVVGGRKNGKLPPYYDFEALLNRWSDAFGEEHIKPRIYSREELLGGDVIHDFIHTLGLQLPESVQLECGETNAALSAEAQCVLLGVNRTFQEAGCTESERFLRGRLVSYLQEHARGKSRQPTRSDALEFYSLFEPSNSMLAKRWFNREKLFESDFSEYPEHTVSISAEKVAEIMAGFILQEKS